MNGVLLFSCIWWCVLTHAKTSIIDGLEKFETLHPSQFTHRRVKRSVNDEEADSKEVEFDSMGRHFHLYLQKKRRLLASGFKVKAVDGQNNVRDVDLEMTDFYQGFVVGETGTSKVSAYWEDDSLTATIHTKDEVYSIEPSWRHLPKSNNHTMIMYTATDLKKSGHLGNNYCGFVNPYDEMDEKFKKEKIQEEESENWSENAKREKRQAKSFFRPLKNTCPLLLVADYRFFDSMGQKNLASTSSYMIGLIDRVDSIYRGTDFGQGYDDMGFEIKEIRIHESPTVVSGTGSHYNEERPSWPTKELLEVFSRDPSYKGFCLAHLFTHQIFDGGVLGLAYIGSPRTYSVGGVCSPAYNKGGYTLYLNTGWSSSLNSYDRRLLTQEADLVTTHEFGHNWGSEHDPDTPECSPSSSSGGKYIMYTYSVSGYEPNNKVFSPCSTRSMGAVLRSKSDICFDEKAQAFCGNSFVEGDEECDVGPEGKHNDDRCCDKNCRLRSGMKCSDANSVCCFNCDYAADSVQCRGEVGNRVTCEETAFCSGDSPDCPASKYRPNNTSCLDKGKCYEGECRPFCESIGKTSCICDSLEDSCKWCCKDRQGGDCKPHLFTELGGYDNLPDGMPCLVGICNQGQCEKHVQDLVERFFNIIENITPSKFVELMKTNIVHTVILLSLILWIPLSCIVSHVDRKRREELEEVDGWKSTEDFLDRRSHVHIERPSAPVST